MDFNYAIEGLRSHGESLTKADKGTSCDDADRFKYNRKQCLRLMSIRWKIPTFQHSAYTPKMKKLKSVRWAILESATAP